MQNIYIYIYVVSVYVWDGGVFVKITNYVSFRHVLLFFATNGPTTTTAAAATAVEEEDESTSPIDSCANERIDIGRFILFTLVFVVVFADGCCLGCHACIRVCTRFLLFSMRVR